MVTVDSLQRLQTKSWDNQTVRKLQQFQEEEDGAIKAPRVEARLLHDFILNPSSIQLPRQSRPIPLR